MIQIQAWQVDLHPGKLDLEVFILSYTLWFQHSYLD